ncbi:MAG: ATP-grasp domain-containing protein [Streptosporangiaceae bacterium]
MRAAQDNDGSVIFIGFTPGGLRGLGQYLPDDSVVFIDEPDVLRKREAVANSAGIATLRELIGWELYEIESAADAFYNANRQRRPAGILPVSDYGVPFAARLAERYGVRGAGYGAARALRDKHLLRQVTRSAGIVNPESVPVSGPAEIRAFMARIGGPIVLKPANRQAAIGTMIIQEPGAAERAWAECMEQEEGVFMPDRPLPLRMLAERYVRGEEFSVEMMFRSGAMAFGGVTRTLLFDGPRPVEQAHVYPADIPAGLRERLLADTVRVLEAVGLDSGWTHCEWRVENGVPYLMECAGRMAGGGIIELIEIASGYDGNGAFLDMMLDRDPAPQPAAQPITQRYAVSWMAGLPQAGEVESIDGREDALAVPGVRSCWIRVKVGDQVTALHSSFDRVLAIRAEGPTPAQALATAQAAMGHVCIKTRPTG